VYLEHHSSCFLPRTPCFLRLTPGDVLQDLLRAPVGRLAASTEHLRQFLAVLNSQQREAVMQKIRERERSHYWGRRYLTRRFFELLRERFRRRLCLVVARRNGEILAGTLNVVKDDAFYGRYWGALRPLRHLHFNVCYYAVIEYCIEQGLARIEPGAGGDYKWLRGFEATPTYSLHFLAEPRLARAVARLLAEEREQAQRVIDSLDRQSPLRNRPWPWGPGPAR